MSEADATAAVIIPARYGSTRLPGKPILEIAKRVTGKYMIQHVYERALQAPSVAQAIVATDDIRVARAVEAFGGQACMTRPNHTSGTDRIAEVAAGLDTPIVVNVQGDEPQIQPQQVEQVIHLLWSESRATMGTLACAIRAEESWRDPNVVKVVLDEDGFALYFSRAPIPFVRNAHSPLPHAPVQPLHHLGIYSYRREFLLQYAGIPPAPLERAEKLEQLRALSHGYRIKVGITPHSCIGIDTPADLERWLDLYR